MDNYSTCVSYFSHKEEGTDLETVYALYDAYMASKKKELVFVCIGTDRCIGDVVGPMVGTKLEALNKDLNVYGTLHFPVHALNIDNRLAEMYSNHPNAFIIGIDACLGDEEDIGMIRLRNVPIRPGKGVGKDLPGVGDMSLVSIVDSSDNSEFFFSRSIRLSFIMDIVDKIIENINDLLIKIEEEALQDVAATVLEDNEVRIMSGGSCNNDTESF